MKRGHAPESEGEHFFPVTLGLFPPRPIGQGRLNVGPRKAGAPGDASEAAIAAGIDAFGPHFPA